MTFQSTTVAVVKWKIRSGKNLDSAKKSISVHFCCWWTVVFCAVGLSGVFLHIVVVIVAMAAYIIQVNIL